MQTIHKYPIDLDYGTDQVISMPRDAYLLDVQSQNGVPAIWAHVDDAQPLVKRRIVIVGTGVEAPNRFSGANYIATVQFRGGFLVLHFFDMGEVA